jgi:GxxExxY protein
MMDRDPLTEKLIGCAIEVHRHLGPGLLESAYEQCMIHEMTTQRVPFRSQVPLPVQYKGFHLDCGYRLDILAAEQVIVELKSVEKMTGLHEAQLLTYMKLAGIGRGLLINFNAQRLVDGVRRFKI